MSLEHKSPGNPALKKGGPSLNPAGRGRGPTKKRLDVKRRLLQKFKIHPVDKLIKIAAFIEATNPEFAGKIWIRLLDSAELEERKQKASYSPAAIDAPESSESEEKFDESLIEALEKHGQDTTASVENSGMAEGQTKIPSETSPEENLRSDPSI